MSDEKSYGMMIISLPVVRFLSVQNPPGPPCAIYFFRKATLPCSGYSIVASAIKGKLEFRSNAYDAVNANKKLKPPIKWLCPFASNFKNKLKVYYNI